MRIKKNKPMKLPSKEQCYSLLAKYRTPEHIIRHSEVVMRVAVFLANELKKKGVQIDSDVVERASLLHDILKVVDFSEFNDTFGKKPTLSDRRFWQKLKDQYANMKHEEAAYTLFKDKYPGVASIIKKHKYNGILDEAEKPITWEEKLVYYADKRVKHEQVVTLEDRFLDGRERYAHRITNEGVKKTEQTENAILALEAEIFSPLDIKPDALKEACVP